MGTKRETQEKTPPYFRSIKSVRRYIARVLGRLEDMSKDVDTDRARVMIYGAKVMAELITQSGLEKRIVDLEKKHGTALQEDAIQ